jgi:hypothetical protein
MNSDVITTRADLEQHLIAIMAALDEQERKTGTPTAAVFVRLMRAIYPVFMRAVDDECRDGVAPNDLLTAIETLVCNMLEYAISISATPGHEIDLGHSGPRDRSRRATRRLHRPRPRRHAFGAHEP